MSKLFDKETDLVVAFLDCLDRNRWGIRDGAAVGVGWTRYPETAGWDLLLHHDETGMQVGIEAKLSLNPKVLCQALPFHRWSSDTGPDYRAVLVPSDACQLHMAELSKHLGITVIKVSQEDDWREGKIWRCNAGLPAEQRSYDDECWFSWLPTKRETLPDYVPDCIAGAPSPVALTPWKIKAIRLMILLDRRGFVTRKDMKALDLSPSRWTERSFGFLVPGDRGYVRGPRTPDLKAQHPRNWHEIEADLDSWNPDAEAIAA